MTLADAMTVCMDMRPEDAACVRAVAGEPGEWFAVDRWKATGPACTVVQDGQAWVIGGMSFINAWTGLFWMVARPGLKSSSWREVIRVYRKLAIEASDITSEHYKHRLEAHVLDGWKGAERFAKSLGLSLESIKRGAGMSGEHVQIWAWTGPPKGK